MISFYPGPSKVYPEIEKYLQDAFQDGILSQNHRSQPFMDLLRETLEFLREKLNIPADYSIIFTSSATECWEIVSQSFIEKSSFHVYNGAFGEKWEEYASKIQLKVHSSRFKINDVFDDESLKDLANEEVICFTQNETSNGTQVGRLTINNEQLFYGSEKQETISYKRETRNTLIAIDATSSMAGIELDWNVGDIWLASVQKCFGLPSGMGIMVCSPKAVQRAEEIGERKHYNSFLFIHENFQKYQTPYTPNILGIYLLKRVLMQVPNIQEVSEKIKARAKDIYDFIEKETSWELLVENKAVRSDTVIAVEGTAEEISVIKQKAKENNITLGNGYGEWKNTTFRIANFPAIEDWESEKLKNLLRK